MKTIITSLFGLDAKLYDQLPVSEKKKFETKFLALIISVLISNVVAIEISQTIFEITDVFTIAIVCGVWSFLMTSMDILLVRKAFPAIIRLLFSFAIIAISAMSFFALITKKDIANNREAEVKQQVTQIENAYKTEKSGRYSVLKTKQEQQHSYHKNICVPEALKVKAGIKYNEKHQHCLSELQEIATLKAELDSNEARFKTEFDNKLAETKKLSSLGFWETMNVTWKEIWNDYTKIVGFIALLIILVCLESVVFFTSLRTKVTKYGELEEKNLQSWEKIVEENWGNKTKIALEEERNRANLELETIKSTARRKGRFSKLDAKTKDLSLLEHIYSEYKIAKQLKPDMNGQICKSFEMLYANAISKEQKEIEDDIIDNATSFSTDDDNSDNFSEVVTDDNTEFDDNIVVDKQRKNYYTQMYYCTTPMKKLADELFHNANGDYFHFARGVFDWAVQNIKYQDSHDLSHYKTGRETFISKSAVCGEMAIFLNALLKYKAFNPNYIHVDVDYRGEKVNHACSSIEVNGKPILIDVAYKQFDVSHQRWNKVSDNELINNMIAWNK